jgi:flavin-dependent thymidylate synthase
MMYSVTQINYGLKDIDTWVEESARVSHGQRATSRSTNLLLQHLLENNHWTPLAQPTFIVGVEGGDNVSLIHAEEMCPLLMPEVGMEVLTFHAAPRRRQEKAVQKYVLSNYSGSMCKLAGRRTYLIRASLYHVLEMARKVAEGSESQEGMGLKVAICNAVIRAMEEEGVPESSVLLTTLRERVGQAAFPTEGSWAMLSNIVNLDSNTNTTIGVLSKRIKEIHDGSHSSSLKVSAKVFGDKAEVNEASALVRSTLERLSTIHCKIEEMPVWLAQQLFRHRLGVVINMISRRYTAVESVEELHPDFDSWRMQSPTKETASSSPLVDWEGDPEMGALLLRCKENVSQTFSIYREMLDKGIAKEVARSVLPQSMQARLYLSVTTEAARRIVDQRGSRFAQAEWAGLVYFLKSHLYE